MQEFMTMKAVELSCCLACLKFQCFNPSIYKDIYRLSVFFLIMNTVLQSWLNITQFDK